MMPKRPWAWIIAAFLLALDIQSVVDFNSVQSTLTDVLNNVQDAVVGDITSSRLEANSTALPYVLRGNESFAACVMTSDDNELLGEWIAYHYTVLPLRALVVANDPRSKQSPLDVLERWGNGPNHTALQYWLWTDEDFMGSNSVDTAQKVLDKQGNHHQLKFRQKYFVSACAKFMRAQNKTWVSFVDSDEFIMFNRVNEQEDGSFRNSSDATRAIVNTTFGQLIDVRESLQKQQKDDWTVWDMIQRIQKMVPKFGPCHTMPRLLHGSLETVKCNSSIGASKTSSNSDEVSFWNSSRRLTTIRYLQHGGKDNFDSRWGKVMLDVSRLDSVLHTLPRNIHRPYPLECIFPYVSIPEAPFRVHHYVGSWERYSSRSHDERRTKDSWLTRSALGVGDSCDLEVHKWLLQFVRMVGMERARHLLGLR